MTARGGKASHSVAGDIVIDTPPKAGTTWTQRICSLLVFGTPHLDNPLTTISPWLDMLTRPLQDVLDDLEAQTHRRFIKTHIPLDGLPFDERVTYICVGRDPRDLALSWDSHMANTDFDAAVKSLVGQVGEAATARTARADAPAARIGTRTILGMGRRPYAGRADQHLPVGGAESAVQFLGSARQTQCRSAALR